MATRQDRRARPAHGGPALHHRHRAATPTTSTAPGQAYAYFVRSPARPRQDQEASTPPTAKAAPGVVASSPARTSRPSKVGGLICGWMVKSKDGQPQKAPAHPVLARRHGALCRRPRGRGDRRDAMAQAKDAAELVEVDYEVLPAGHRSGAGARCGRAAVHAEAPGNLCYDWELGDKAAIDAAFAKARARHQARPRQQPADPERDGAARGDRRVRPRHRQLHLLHHEPEPARAAPGPVAPSSGHARAQAARGGARCRRRLRLEDLHLRRGDVVHLGRRRRSAARSSGRPSAASPS